MPICGPNSPEILKFSLGGTLVRGLQSKGLNGWYMGLPRQPPQPTHCRPIPHALSDASVLVMQISRACTCTSGHVATRIVYMQRRQKRFQMQRKTSHRSRKACHRTAAYNPSSGICRPFFLFCRLIYNNNNMYIYTLHITEYN